MRGRDLAHVGAAAFADNRESEQRAHLLQGESQLPRAAHEAEASHVLPRIPALAAPALRYRPQSAPLIITVRTAILAGAARSARHSVLYGKSCHEWLDLG